MSETGFGCAVGDDLVICSPRGGRFRAVRYCSTCKRRRRFLVTFYVWYGPHEVCCACGDAWNEGYRQVRPAVRGWRDKARRALSAEWLSETATRADAEAWLQREIEPYLSET